MWIKYKWDFVSWTSSILVVFDGDRQGSRELAVTFLHQFRMVHGCMQCMTIKWGALFITQHMILKCLALMVFKWRKFSIDLQYSFVNKHYYGYMCLPGRRAQVKMNNTIPSFGPGLQRKTFVWFDTFLKRIIWQEFQKLQNRSE